MNTTAALFTDLFTDLATALAIDPFGLYHLESAVNPPPLLASLESSAEPDPDHW